MRPRERRDSGEQDLFRARLDQIIDLNHALAKLARAIGWRFLESKFGAVYTEGVGRPPLPTRLMAGLAILKHTFNLSDEVVCDRWLENPYYQYFCGEEFFQHALPFERSSITRWRGRMGEERLEALLQESLAVAVRTGAMKPSDLNRVIVDTTVQPKNITFPTDAKLANRAREKLVSLAGRRGVKLRQSYRRVGKFVLIMHQRYAHARQFGRAKRSLRKLKTYLGRVIRDISRKIADNPWLETKFAKLLALARRVHAQERGQRGPKVYSLHAPEVECIGKGKPHKPYEFGVKVSVATTLKRSKGGQFAIHAQALPAIPMTATRSPRSFRRSSNSSATKSSGCMPTPATAATTRRPSTSSRSTPPSRSAASHRKSNARCAAAPPSNQSSGTSRTSTAWPATISTTAPATPTTPSWPRSATISASCCGGSVFSLRLNSCRARCRPARAAARR